ncbi:hypothetical protein K2173_007357 [Erythroxylum novogranatense]|uniref:RING-type domain-containing protein n=1 Tax=Erythroxylum novogranatense TaxID=1862640 RepID=A0AAV8T5Z2_9ROSI|nr:hypothetical protein K2173_007357 [Erythroxylum novogranatense]
MVLHYADVPSTSLTPPPITPPPTSLIQPPPADEPNMLVSIFMALFLPFAGMSAMLIIYICLLWYRTNLMEVQFPVKPVAEKGLSASELEKLPKITGKELVLGGECAVCLDEIGNEQPVRLVPGCNHGFHVECADAWLSKHSQCPVCRAQIDARFLNASDENPC